MCTSNIHARVENSGKDILTRSHLIHLQCIRKVSGARLSDTIMREIQDFSCLTEVIVVSISDGCDGSRSHLISQQSTRIIPSTLVTDFVMT